MTLPTTARKIFALSALATLASVGCPNAIPTALAQVNNANHVCYLYGTDGQKYDLSALCGVAEPASSSAEEAAIEATAEMNAAEDDGSEANVSAGSESAASESAASESAETAPAATVGESPSGISKPLSATDNSLPTIENTTRLPAAPGSVGN